MARSFDFQPSLFTEYFLLGKNEEVSPFLSEGSRKWGKELGLKAAFVAAFLWGFALLFRLAWPEPSLSALCLVGTYFFAGTPSMIGALEDLADLDVNIDVLMTLAAFASIAIGSALEGGLLLVLFALSGAMEEVVTQKARGSLHQLQKLSPTKATVLDERGHFFERAVQEIGVGTHILVRSGEVVPLDGIVRGGISSVNLVHLTGESLPVKKGVGDTVAAGARNLEGALEMEVTKTSAESTLTRMIELVMQAQEARPKLQKWFDRLSRSYALTIIAISGMAALFFPIWLGLPFLGEEGAFYRAIAFLVAASPCALIIALPIAYLSAISACAKKGVFLKGGTALDQLNQCRILAFDKTGTLTTGHLQLLQIEPQGQEALPLTKILSIAYGLEKNAVHPIAGAVQRYAQEREIQPAGVVQFRTIPGYGVEGTIGGSQVFMGHPDYLSPEELMPIQGKMEEIRKRGFVLAVLRMEKSLVLFSFQDQLRQGLAETLDRLKKTHSWRLLMLSGDHAANAAQVASALGIPEFYADLKPEEKLERVALLSREGGLAMIGDGINDAPALARATVGIAMGKVGSGIAIDAADIILLQDNLELLDWLLWKAKQTEVIVRQNLCIASFAILFASFPALAGWVPLWLAVILHEGGTVLVGLNALRLLR